jgi:hypothetical protein
MHSSSTRVEYLTDITRCPLLLLLLLLLLKLLVRAVLISVRSLMFS